MPDALPQVTQEFDADVQPYLDGVEEMIAATDHFRESVDAALAAVEALHAAIDDLPNEKTIHVNVETSGMPEAAAAGAAGGAPNTAGFREAEDAANGLDEALARLDEILKEQGGDWEEVDLGAGKAAESLDEVGRSYQQMVDEGILPADNALRGVGEAADEATVPFERVRGDAADLDAALRDMGAAAPSAAAGLAAAGTAAEDSGNAARGAYGWWGLLTKEVTLFGGVLGSANMIGSVALWHIALDGLFESAVALGEGLAALTVGIASMVPAAEDIYTHLQAVHTVTSALGVDIPPVTGKFQALAQAMEPATLEAYGGALDLVNSKGSVLARVAGQVVAGLDDWIAKLDVWHSAQAGMGGMLENGVGFLHQFEQVVNNVGLAIDNLIKADPGTAHYLMDLVVGFTKVLDVVTSIPAPILMAALALHSFMLWGGLLTTGLMKLGTGLVNFGTSIAGAGTGLIKFLNQIGTFGEIGQEAVIPLNDLRTAEAGARSENDSLAASFLPLAANPFTWIVVAAAALVAVSVAAANAKTSTQQWVASLEQGVSQARGLAQIGQTYQDLTQVTGALAGAQQQLATATSNSGAVMGTCRPVYGHLQPRSRDRRQQRQRPVWGAAAVVEGLRQRGRQR